MNNKCLLFIFLFIFSTVLSASPKFGIAASTVDGIGFGIVEDVYEARLLLNTYSNDAQNKDSLVYMTANFDYKMAMTEDSAFSIGLRYNVTSGKNNDVDVDTVNEIGLALGIHHMLETNICLSAHVDLYQLRTDKWSSSDTEVKSTYIGGRDGRMGILVLF
tara:strand:- start:4654 stop:5136 length:483 start_codon:yes stop_codon:yes gene_type:complete